MSLQTITGIRAHLSPRERTYTSPWDYRNVKPNLRLFVFEPRFDTLTLKSWFSALSPPCAGSPALQSN
ncbi:hypothetical protein EYF80_016952 [Liparis tanakae]|uniref:Uncharacterized protein n=1 Tax=Liparis tanakae TaxID=230148 RepID=A0A4Z2I4Z1_9TELE|nr:hypothetical protein EYF80_016952 [Liparis tanakae]